MCVFSDMLVLAAAAAAAGSQIHFTKYVYRADKETTVLCTCLNCNTMQSLEIGAEFKKLSKTRSVQMKQGQHLR
jgi:hypothetical protein